MTSLPQSHSSQRAARAPLADITPAVLRSDDGSCTMGKLQIISLTGGLLCLPRPLDQGSRIKLVFLTHTGPVLGAAEMLRPLSWSLQPFQFVALREGDQHRLRAAIQSSLDLRTDKSSSKPKAPVLFAEKVESSRIIDGEQQWIDNYRAALVLRKPPQRRLLRMAVGAVTLAALGSVFYVLHVHLLR